MAPDGDIRSPPHQHHGKAGPGSPSCLPLVLCSNILGMPGACGSWDLPGLAVEQRLALFFAAITWMFSSKRLRLHS